MMKICMEGDRAGKHQFRKAGRLLKRSDFVRLSQKNRKVQNQHFVALYDQGTTGRTRLGITVTKRVGNAVARNQLKRYVREYFRHHRQKIQSEIDINIIVKTTASGIPSKEAYRSLQNIFCKVGKEIDFQGSPTKNPSRGD